MRNAFPLIPVVPKPPKLQYRQKTKGVCGQVLKFFFFFKFAVKHCPTNTVIESPQLPTAGIRSPYWWATA
jgi:hypothetical protein